MLLLIGGISPFVLTLVQAKSPAARFQKAGRKDRGLLPRTDKDAISHSGQIDHQKQSESAKKPSVARWPLPLSAARWRTVSWVPSAGSQVI